MLHAVAVARPMASLSDDFVSAASEHLHKARGISHCFQSFLRSRCSRFQLELLGIDTIADF